MEPAGHHHHSLRPRPDPRTAGEEDPLALVFGSRSDTPAEGSAIQRIQPQHQLQQRRAPTPVSAPAPTLPPALTPAPTPARSLTNTSTSHDEPSSMDCFCCEIKCPQMRRRIMSLALFSLVVNTLSLITDDIQLAQIKNRGDGLGGTFLAVIIWATIVVRFLAIPADIILFIHVKKYARAPGAPERVLDNDGKDNFRRDFPTFFWISTNGFLILLHMLQIPVTFWWVNAKYYELEKKYANATMANATTTNSSSSLSYPVYYPWTSPTLDREGVAGWLALVFLICWESYLLRSSWSGSVSEYIEYVDNEYKISRRLRRRAGRNEERQDREQMEV